MFIEQAPGIHVQELFTFQWNAVPPLERNTGITSQGQERSGAKGMEHQWKHQDPDVSCQQRTNATNVARIPSVSWPCCRVVRVLCSCSALWSIQHITPPTAEHLQVTLENLGQVPTFLKLNSQGQPGSLGCLPSQWKDRCFLRSDWIWLGKSAPEVASFSLLTGREPSWLVWDVIQVWKWD